MAIRRALGAGQARLTRQLLTESLLLSLFGGIAGLAILFSLKDFLLRLVPENLPRLNEISISWSVLLFVLTASVVSGVLFGLAPALQAGRIDLNHALKQEGRASTGSGERARTRRGLVITEFALSLVLLVTAGLLLRSFWDLLNVQLGFTPQWSNGQAFRQTIFICWQSHCCAVACLMTRITTTLRKSRSSIRQWCRVIGLTKIRWASASRRLKRTLRGLRLWA